MSREALEAFEWIFRQARSPSPTMPDGMDEKAALVRDALAEPPGVDAEHFYRVMSQLGKAACRVDDLVTLCKRLSRALKSHNPGHPLHIETADYLRREGLTGSPMRTALAELIAMARRYQWLREHTVATGLSQWVHPHQFLDAAIDAAMQEQEL